MAVGVIEVSRTEYPGSLTLFVLITCVFAATGGLIFGYDIGISGGVTSMDSFLDKFFHGVYKKRHESANQYCQFDSQLLTTFTSSLYIDGLIASFFASTVTRKFGRKVSMLFGGAAFLAGSALNGAAVNVEMLILGRILLGVGVGFANQAVPVYLSEMAPAGARGALNIGFQLMTTIGILAANLVNYGTDKIQGGWGWRLSLALAAVPAGIMTVGAIFLPDTPNSLIQRGKNDRGKAMLKRIRGTEDVKQEYDDIMEAQRVSETVEHPFRNILERRYRPQLVMAIAIPLEIRSAGQSITVCTNLLFTFVVAQAFLAMLCYFKFGIFLFFSGWVIVMTVFVALFLPETKNVPIEEVGRIWSKHWFWGKIVPPQHPQHKHAAPAAVSIDLP